MAGEHIAYCAFHYSLEVGFSEFRADNVIKKKKKKKLKVEGPSTTTSSDFNMAAPLINIQPYMVG